MDSVRTCSSGGYRGGKDIIFEGVETRQQVEFLRDYGYDKAQGYVFSKPVPIPDFEKWMDV